jgi:hypothetical protein
LGAKTLEDENEVQITAIKLSIASSSSSAAGPVTKVGGTSSMSSPVRVKLEHTDENSSRAKRRKQTHKTYNFIMDDIIDMTLMED